MMKRWIPLLFLLFSVLCSHAQNNEGYFSIAHFSETSKDTLIAQGAMKGRVLHISIPKKQDKGRLDIYIDKEKNSLCILSTNPDSITVIFNLNDYFKLLESAYCEQPCGAYSFNQQPSKEAVPTLQHYIYQGNGEQIMLSTFREGTVDMMPLLKLLHWESFVMHIPTPKGAISLLEHRSKDTHTYTRCQFTAAKVDDNALRMPKTTQVMHLENLSSLKDQGKVQEFFKGLTSQF